VPKLERLVALDDAMLKTSWIFCGHTVERRHWFTIFT